MIQLRNLDSSLKAWITSQSGIGPVGELFYLAASSGNPRAYLRGDRTNGGAPFVDDEHLFATGPYAPYTACTTYGNDIVVVMPDSHTWYGASATTSGSALTWSKYCTHMIGMAPFSKGGGPRARFGHSGLTMANFMTMSGWNNLFKNLYWMHGSSTGGASDVTLMTPSGAYSVFEQCHFGGPNDATQAASANYAQIVSGGSQNYFKDCLFGGMNAIGREGANTILKLTGGQGLVFENCIFWSRANATTPYFINVSAASTGGCVRAMFLNCQFINVTPLDGSYDLAVGIVSTPTAADENYLFFDNRCTFAGCTDVIANGNEDVIFWGGAGAHSDVSALADRKSLGLAAHPESS